jgi:hypothetical protein
MADDGFVDVVTRPAGAHSLSVPGLGTFAPGAGPVIGADGTVYLATLEGKIFALHADGSPFWSRELPAGSGQRIMASPTVGADQSVYVVGVGSAVVHDHRDSQVVSFTRYNATLYKFTPGGGFPAGSSTPFPDLKPAPTARTFGPMVTGEPRVWRFGADEALMVSALYPGFRGLDLHILAFAPSGGVMADVTVAHWADADVTGESAIDWGALLGHFGPGVTPPPPPPPLRLGVFTNPQGGTPFVTIPNGLQYEIVGYTFCVGPECSPAPGFTERFRTQHAPEVLLSSPLTLPDLHTIVGTANGVVFSGPNMTSASPVTGTGPLYAAPILTADQRAVLVSSGGSVVGLRNHSISSSVSLGGGSTARAAASRTHVFVSTTDGFFTLDANAETKLFEFPWVGGGIWPPAIGPDGRVYAMASDVLFIFPPPAGRHSPVAGPLASDPLRPA